MITLRCMKETEERRLCVTLLPPTSADIVFLHRVCSSASEDFLCLSVERLCLFFRFVLCH